MHLVKHKISRPQLLLLNEILQQLEYTPANKQEVIINGIAQNLIEKIRRKSQGFSNKITLSYQNYEALAFGQWLHKAPGSALLKHYEETPLYRLLESLERQSHSV
jgi:hypothetical protein